MIRVTYLFVACLLACTMLSQKLTAQFGISQLRGPHGGVCTAFALTEDGTLLANGPCGPMGIGGREKLLRRPLAGTTAEWLPWRIESSDTTELYAIQVVLPGLIYAGCSDGLWESREHPAGRSWFRAGFEGTRITALAYLPDSCLYLGTGDGEMYKSSDKGDSWTPLPAMPGHLPRSFVMDDSRRLYFQDYHPRCYRLEDTVWTQFPQQHKAVRALLPVTGETFLFAGGTGLERSTDGGNTFSEVLRFEYSGDFASMVSSGTGNLYASATGLAQDTVYDGVYKSVDQGITWKKLTSGGITGLRLGVRGELVGAVYGTGIVLIDTASGEMTYRGGHTAHIHQIAFNGNGEHVFATLDTIEAYFPGIVHSPDEGWTWEWIPLSYRTPTHIRTDGVQTVLTWSWRAQRLHISRNNGESWERAEMPARSVAVLPHSSGSILVGAYDPSGQVHFSTTNGTTWESATVASGEEIVGLVENSQAVLAATTGGIYISTDEGRSWQRRYQIQDTSLWITGLATTPTDWGNSTPFVRATYASSTGTGVLASDDAGNTWQQIPVSAFSGILHTPGEALGRGWGTRVLAASDFDFTTGPSGQLQIGWDLSGPSFLSSEIQATHISIRGWSRWFIGTRGRGVWFSQLINSVESRASAPMQINLRQNYPNPFNPATTISYELPHEMTVRLVVTDALGRVVWTAGRRRQEAGNNAVTFDASGLPSGVYFYRLETEDVMLVRKMVLLK